MVEKKQIMKYTDFGHELWDIGKHESTIKNNMVGYIFTRTQNGTYVMRQKDLLMMIPHQMLLTMIRRVLLN